MRKTMIALMLLATGLLPAPAWAGGCERLWRPSTEPPLSTSAPSVRIVTMRQNGTILYAAGPLGYARSVPSLDRQIVEWFTPRNSPAAQLFSDEPLRPGPGGSVARRLVPAAVALSMKRSSATPGGTRVQLTIGNSALLGVGTPVAFEATCSPSGILHGASEKSAYLIYVDIPF